MPSLGINYEEKGSSEEIHTTIKTFLAEHKVPYRCAIGDNTTRQQVPDLSRFPTTLFLDREGKVRLKLEGAADKAELAAILTRLLDEK